MIFETQSEIDHLIDCINVYEPSVANEIIFYPYVDKWLAASAMQKAIRRGHIKIALSAAFSLLETDREKLWKRLQVIALEDISLSQPDSTRDILRLCSQNQWRRKYLSDDRALRYVIMKLCNANKSRIANDLLCIVNVHPAETEIALEFYKLSNQQLADIYLSSQYSVEHRLIAGWYICGVYRRRYRNMKQRKGDWRYFLSLHNSEKYPEALQLSLKQGCSSGEGHFRAIALSWEILNNAETIEFRNECTQVTPFCGFWKSEAFDIHTVYGQSAYKSVVKSNNPLSSFMRTYFPEQNHVRMLGMSLFAVEGMQLDKREIFGGIDALLDKATDAYVANYNLSGSAKEEFFEIVKSNIDLIYKERADAALRLDWTPRVHTIKN